jgi:hypothetical protein
VDETLIRPRTSTADHAHRAALAKFGRLCEWIRDDLVENVDPFKVESRSKALYGAHRFEVVDSISSNSLKAFE